MEEVIDTEYGYAPPDRDPEAIRAFLDDLCLVGEIQEGGDGSWAVIGEMVPSSDERFPDGVDLSESWSDFKHDLAVLKEAGISTMYGANQPPGVDVDQWIISLNASTINV
jgi:hypothetical protein